jgi:hypothetical protein
VSAPVVRASNGGMSTGETMTELPMTFQRAVDDRSPRASQSNCSAPVIVLVWSIARPLNRSGLSERYERRSSMLISANDPQRRRR